MPNRIIRDSCKTSKSLDQLSAEAERLWWRLITVADDFGRFEAEPVLLLSKCFPRKAQIYDLLDIAKWYAELEACELVRTYVSKGQLYGFFVTWGKYQTMRAKASKYPDPNKCLQTQTDSLVIVVGSASADANICSPETQKAEFPSNVSFENPVNPKPRKPKGKHVRDLTLPELPEPARNLAEQLKASILENNPDAKITSSQLTAWTRDADRLLRIDQRDPQDASELLEWSQHDSFWLRNILSMGKFRQQYDRLKLAAQVSPQRPPRSQLPHPTAPDRKDPGKFCANCGTIREWHSVNGAGHSLALERFQCAEFVEISLLP